ncbi:MAG TPA: hypothetical protein VFB14_08435 [Bryobacteraceae bacterium]|nr:hypothetical protein [Bryobacteraceae bacterium]
MTEAITDAEWHVAIDMLETVPHGKRGTVGADSGYDYPRFVNAVPELDITPHVAQHSNRSSSLDGLPPVMPATRSACKSASALSKSSAAEDYGNSPQAAASGTALAAVDFLRWLWPPTIWCA